MPSLTDGPPHRPLRVIPGSAMTAALIMVAILVWSVHAPLAQPVPTYDRAKKLFKDGVFLYDTDNYEEALKIFLASQQLNSRSTTILYIARCHGKLGQDAEALRYYRMYIPAYSSEPRKRAHPPAIIREVNDQIRLLEARTRPVKPVPKKPYVPPKPRESTSSHWLILGITTAVLTIGFETMAWISFAKAEQHYEVDPEFEDYSNVTLAGHVLAAAFAVASGVSFYLHYREHKRVAEPPRASIAIVPDSTGFSIMGLWRF